MTDLRELEQGTTPDGDAATAVNGRLPDDEAAPEQVGAPRTGLRARLGLLGGSSTAVAVATRLGRRRLPYTAILALLVAIVTPLGALYYSASQSNVYAARAEVLATGTEGVVNPTHLAAAVTTQQVVLRSRQVLAPAAAAVGVTVESLEDAVKVSVVPESTVLRVSVEHGDREQALALVDAVVSTYVDQRPVGTFARAREVVQERIAALSTRQQDVEAELEAVEAANAQADELGVGVEFPTAERRLAAESANLLDRIGRLEDELTDLEISNLRDEESALVSPAHVLPDPVSPKPKQATALGAFVGLLLASTLILGRAQLVASRRDPLAGT